LGCPGERLVVSLWIRTKKQHHVQKGLLRHGRGRVQSHLTSDPLEGGFEIVFFVSLVAVAKTNCRGGRG